MPTVTRRLPARPHLAVPKREARELLELWRVAQAEALERIRRSHPKFHAADDATLASAVFRLSDAQLVIAREYGFTQWAELKRRIASYAIVNELDDAIRANDRGVVVRLLRANPELLHVPVWSGNWGPPMSHAANLGRLEIIEAVAGLGARDYQHAFERALLQGRIDCARWLLQHGARLTPGIVMGSCETLKPSGLRFLAELGAAFTDERGNRLAPMALALETYTRNPAGKHEVLALFAQQGYDLPDTPIMAFHCGRIDRLEKHLDRDPTLIERRFRYRQIYPPALGCADDGRSGMHGTPLDGTTLLHLAIDFGEQEIFDLLLTRGADVNARALVDADGFGGHTPLFNAVVSSANSCRLQRDAAMARALLDRGAARDFRTSLRKFLDWREAPGWHVARDVTAAQWGRDFPEKSWVNQEALRRLDGG